MTVLWRYILGVTTVMLLGSLGAVSQTPNVRPGMLSVTTEVSKGTRATDFFLPNDQVDVVLSHKATGRSAELILTNVRVLNIEKNIAALLATLELSPSQAEILAQAKQRGELSLALHSNHDADSKDKSSKSSEPENSIVRFGIGISKEPGSNKPSTTPSSAPLPKTLADTNVAKNDKACSDISAVTIMKITSADFPKWIVLCGQHPNGLICELSNDVLREFGSKTRIRCQGRKQ